MSFYIWTKAGAWLITKSTRYWLPAVIAFIGGVGGFIFGKKK